MLLFQHSALGRAAQTTSPAASQPTDKPANETVRQSEQRRRKEVPGTLLPGNPLKLTRYHKKNAVLDLTPGLVFFGSVFSFLEIAKRKTWARREQTNQPRNKHTNKQTNTPAKKETNQPSNKTRRDRRNQGETDATKQGHARKILEGFFGTKGSKRSCKFPLFNIIKAGVGCSEWAPRCWVYYGETTRS